MGVMIKQTNDTHKNLFTTQSNWSNHDNSTRDFATNYFSFFYL